MTRIVFLILWLVPCSAQAQPITVVSGDHDGFTRLAILFEVPDGWQFGRVENGYELRSGLKDAEFDLETVFRRIGRNRIAEVEQRSDGRLFVASDCACSANVFAVPRALVIDIRDGAVRPDSPFEVAIAPYADDTLQADSPNDDPILDRGTAIIGPAFVPVQVPNEVLPDSGFGILTDFTARSVIQVDPWAETLALDLSGQARNEMPSPPHGTPDQDQSERLTALQQALIEQFSRAAGQGMIEADQSEILALLEARDESDAEENHVPSATAPDPKPAPEAEETEQETGLEALAGLANVTVETAIDRGRLGYELTNPETSDGGVCISGDRLDLKTWGTGVAQGAELGSYRAELVGEFDEGNTENIDTLIRTYLYLTFGEEVQALISTFELEGPDTRLYSVIAEIMDYGFAVDPGPLSDQMSCETRAALWAVLARPEIPPGDIIATNAVLSAFSELPLHIRRHVGPGLVDRFLAFGDVESANVVRNAVSRAPGDHGESLKRIDADMAFDAGDTKTGAEILSGIVQDDTHLSPDALVRLIDSDIDTGSPIPGKLRDNAAALAFLNRGTPLGVQLQRVVIRALAHSDPLESAFKEFEASQSVFTQDVQSELRLELFSELVDRADPVFFLQKVLPGPVQLGASDEADDLRLRIAQRLVEMRFTEAAVALLSDDPSLPTDEERLTYAEAFLIDRRPDLVVGYLAGMDSVAAKAILAEAHEMAGEYSHAADTYAEIENDTARGRALWRDENWGGAAELLEGPISAAAELAVPKPDLDQSTEQEQAFEESPLLASRDLLNASKETRRILDDLLTGLPQLEAE